MTLKTRKPSGKPDWPILLLAGAEKAGKSYSCAQASASEKIHRTFWVSIGETDPDAYGAIPGADFEIVEHNGHFGTPEGILVALGDVASEARKDRDAGYVDLLVVDSMTRLWDQITDTLNGLAEKRPHKREAVVTMDLWTRGKGWWRQAVQAILAFPGPALLTARLEAVTVMDGAGKPTSIKADKVKTEKSLPYDVDGVIQMPERGKTFIEGVRSVQFQLDGRQEFPGFTVDKLWDAMGLEDIAPRTVSEPQVDEPADSIEVAA